MFKSQLHFLGTTMVLTIALASVIPARAVASPAPSLVDRAIYDALEVEPILVDRGGALGESIHMKSIGGLDCKKTRVVRPGFVGADYECDFIMDHVDAEAIYKALDVEPSTLSNIGMTIHRKETGRLTCEERKVVRPSTSVQDYTCELQACE